jgi:hypothetical protein
MNVGASVYSSSEGARHRSSGSNATRHTAKAVAKRAAEAAKRAAKEAGRCTSRRCVNPSNPNGPGTAARYTEAQCVRYCPPGSTSGLCGTCEGQVGNPKLWHGVMGGPLPPYSHIRLPGHPLTNWNAATQAKEQGRTAKATKSQAPKTQGRRGPAYTLKNKTSSEHRSNGPLTLRQRTSSNTRRARTGRRRGGLTQVKSQKRGYSWF